MNSVCSYASVALLKGEVYVFGGGDGRTWYNADVEMFDLRLERWIGMLSLRQKRFSLAAAEIDGVLYVAGGFDGKDYLRYALVVMMAMQWFQASKFMMHAGVAAGDTVLDTVSYLSLIM
ncbi:hypothetical protein Pint_34967 [Pistacia integerrima]|uniref:Uncharacterized protein n=1 Tax=Pistacia integerrima TaxID=434235 RepID=A0ACC0Y5F2_9ROSI|nr:hypothetical protein Pint_34967 [Pistacia integerrima]